MSSSPNGFLSVKSSISSKAEAVSKPASVSKSVFEAYDDWVCIAEAVKSSFSKKAGSPVDKSCSYSIDPSPSNATWPDSKVNL